MGRGRERVIYCNTGQSESDIGIVENVFCLVNGSLEGFENKMETYHPFPDPDIDCYSQVTLSFCSR